MTPELPRMARYAINGTALLGYLLAGVGLTQVFSGWLPSEVIHPLAFQHQRGLLYAALALGLLAYAPPRLWNWHRERTGWCRAGARALHRQLLGLSLSGFFRYEVGRGLRSIVSRMAKPTPYAALPLVLVSGVVALLLVAGFRLYPEPQPSDPYLTLWQMQLAWGGAALPILLFIIEFSDRRPGTVQALPDVLTRHSLVLPILGITLGLVIALATGSYWFPSSWAFPIAFVAFTLSAALTAWAFFRLILLLYDRQELRRRSLELLLERFRTSLTGRLRFRLRSLVLQRWIASQQLVGIAGVQRIGGSGKTVNIQAPDDAHHVLDVNLVLLDIIARHLATASVEASSATEEETSPLSAGPPRPLLLLNKVPGELVWGSEPLAVVPEPVSEAHLAELQDMLWRAYRFERRQGDA